MQGDISLASIRKSVGKFFRFTNKTINTFYTKVFYSRKESIINLIIYLGFPISD